MLNNNVYMVTIWTGEVKPCKKVVLFPELDQSGTVFYKIEGQLNTDYFMIAYSYDLTIALSEFNRILTDFMESQILALCAD